MKWKKKYSKNFIEKLMKTHADDFDGFFISFLLKIVILIVPMPNDYDKLMLAYLLTLSLWI